jgi:hypothetical protein
MESAAWSPREPELCPHPHRQHPKPHRYRRRPAPTPHQGTLAAPSLRAVPPTTALGVARAVRTETFSINNFVYNSRAPFGGVKNSGVGRDSGREGYESYLELKTVNLDALTQPLSQLL